MTVEEKISHIREAAMEEARARGNEIIDQHQKALESVFKTHKQEAVMQADTRIKTETASARQQLNTATSKGQLKLRRQLSRVQNELKNKLFEEVREMTDEYMKTEEYKELLVSYIAKAARFADGNPLMIYINSSDQDKKEFLEKRTGMTVTVSEEDFIGGIRSVIPGRNILIDHSFSGALEKEYEEFTFKGGVTGEAGNTGFKMSEMVYVGKEKLVGEVISLDKDRTTIQVYEETSGLRPGEIVEASGEAVSVTLAPGILDNIFDGIERPLERIAENAGAFITRGISVDSLDTQKFWDTKLVVNEGDVLHGGDIYAEVQETRAIVHKCMVPPDLTGTVTFVASDGEHTIKDHMITLRLDDGTEKILTMIQRWPIRVPRPVHDRIPACVPLVTGQRILDTMFPIAKGGTAAIPGGFGTGKTMTQHQIAKWSDADIIIYIGCGERGNEMTQVLEEFSELVDPKSGNPLMDRTTLIANTSNMPVAAREASIYTGLTLAEYYRDMGYDVAIMADSTSRWAEALRELSGRLEEMPAEEGFPAYLASRLSAFYERAGMMHNLNGTDGSVTIIGAVSPQGGDFSEPVTQNTKRFVRCFWGLDKSLAYARHFPAIHWLTSYSEYLTDLGGWYRDHVSPNFVDYRNRLMAILNQESSLMEIVKLIGGDVLPDDQKLTLEIARVIRLGFLQQNAFHKDDTCVSMEKQFKMMEVILYLYQKSRELVARGMPMSVLKAEGIFEKVIAIKYDVPNDNLQLLDLYHKQIDDFYDAVLEKNA